MVKGAKIAVNKDVSLRTSNTTIKKVKAGDIDSFRELFNQWKGPIHNFVAKMIGSRSNAEDITQEVFLTVYNKIHTLRNENFFKQWIYTIAKHSTLNWIAKNAATSKTISKDSSDIPIKHDSTPENDIFSRDLERVVKLNLDKMPADCKLAFVLRIFNELEYKEIASITGWPLSKVKMNIHRARLFMRNRLRSFVKE